MIYVCEYDNSIQDSFVEEQAVRLGLCADAQSGACEQSGKNAQFSEARRKKLRERVLARLLLETVLRREYGIAQLGELDIRTGEKGKPYSAAHPELQFNLSHCDTACACILSDEENGIDVERKFAFRPSLARRVCTEEEQGLLEACDGQERLLQQLWSMKESFVKLDGKGLGYGVKNISLAPFFSGNPEAVQQEYGVFFLVRSAQRYTLAACTKKAETQVITWSESELYALWKEKKILRQDREYGE